MRASAEHLFTGTTAPITDPYDPDVTLLGSAYSQYTGPTPDDRYVSLTQPIIKNMIETNGGFSSGYPHVYKWSDRYYWVFLADLTTAAVTRRIFLHQYDVQTNSSTFKGIILINTALAGNKTSRALRAFVTNHVTGTVSTSGTSTTITGLSTSFQSDRIASGARIGFGSTDPTQITSWYNITAISSNTQLTIDSAVNLPGGTSYVIEEIRILYGFTSTTATNGGLFLVKGLNYNTFTPGGTNIPDAVATDNVQAAYFLKDDATTTMTILAGIGSEDDVVTPTSHNVYVLNADTTTIARLFKHNIRAALTVSSGATTSTFVFKTGQSGVLTGTIPQSNNGRVFAVQHGDASGIKSFYFVTATRIYRCALTDITDGSTTFLSDFMIEIPPGSSTTHTPISSFASVDYSSSLDRLLIPVATSRFGIYVAKYDTTGTLPFEKMAGGLMARVKLSTTFPGAVDSLSPQSAISVWTDSGYAFSVPTTTTNGFNWLHIMNIGGDGFYASTTGQYVITPRISTLNATKLYRAYVLTPQVNGSYELGVPSDPFRVYYRTSGIDDNSGSWVELPKSGDLTGVAPSDYIQFRLALDIIGDFCVPARIYGILCSYEDGSQDSHYLPSLTKSSAASRIIAWKQIALWGSSIPDLRIRLYNASTGFLVLEDTVAVSGYGVFEYSLDGITWSAWDDSQDAVGNYIRYTATTLPSNITVRALLTQT